MLKLRLAHYAYVVVFMVENGGSPYLLKYQEHHLSHDKIVFSLSSTFKKENIISIYYFYVAFVKFWWYDIHILIYIDWQIFMLPCNITTHETEMKFGFSVSQCYGVGFAHIFQCKFLVEVYSLIRHSLNSYFKSDRWSGLIFTNDFLNVKCN